MGATPLQATSRLIYAEGVLVPKFGSQEELESPSKMRNPVTLSTFIDISTSSHHHAEMRTTLNIEEDALAYAKQRAQASGQSLGAVISEILREAARPHSGGIALSEDGMPYIPAKAGAKRISSRHVGDALDHEEIEKHAFTRR